MRVKIPKMIEPFLMRNRGANGKWLKIGRQSSVNIALGRYCQKAGLPTFSLYAARHSWATIARRLGIEKAIVDECLAHVGDFRLADIYAERNWDLINGANEKVLKYVFDDDFC